MTNEKAIVTKGLSKVYYKKDSSRSVFFDKFKPNKSGQSFYALKDINLEINKGEVIGIIGPNGAGKSTLLKILAEVTPPTNGSVEIYGKVASILEIGIGFQPELSGYENIFLSGKLYGLSKNQIQSKIDSIIAMFGFPDFIDTEVKHYSSGMYMRLAFSIIINIEADIYLFDEILSVGDSSFQAKAIKEIEKIKNNGALVMLVTHFPKSVYHICDNILVLNNGRNHLFAKPLQSMLEFNKILCPQLDNNLKNNYLDFNDIIRTKNILNLNCLNSFDITSFEIFSNPNDKEIFCDFDIFINIKVNYNSLADFSFALVIIDIHGTVLVSHKIKLPKSKSDTSKSIKITINKDTFNEAIYTFEAMIINSKGEIEITFYNLLTCNFINSIGKISEDLGYINLNFTSIID